MTDFLGNLIRRSAGESAPQSILRPRLPSMFEPLGGGNELPDLPFEPVEREPVVPTRRPISAATETELPTFHRGDNVEPTPRTQAVEPVQTHTPAPLQHLPNPPMLSSKHEAIEPEPPAAQLTGPRQTTSVFSKPEEPERTILPPSVSRPARNVLPPKQTPTAQAPKKRVRRPPEEGFSTDVQSADSLPRSIQLGQEPIETAINSVKSKFIENSPERKLVEKALEQPKRTLTPILPVITVAMDWSPVTTAQSEPTPTQDLQRTVEIHIGRIEVRAAAPAVSSKRAAKRATMSLEEYLRSRPGEKP